MALHLLGTGLLKPVWFVNGRKLDPGFRFRSVRLDGWMQGRWPKQRHQEQWSRVHAAKISAREKGKGLDMKFGKTGRLWAILGTATAVLAVSAGAQPAPHELIVAVSFTGDSLLSFWSDAPGTLLQSHPITGLQTGEQIQGIDSWDGQVFGLGSRRRLYSIDPQTGQATQVGTGQFGSSLGGSAFGFQCTSVGIRVVSELDINQSICRTTGACSTEPVLRYTAGDSFAGTSPNITSLAYDRRSDTLYALDYLRKSLSKLDPNTGFLTTLVPGGIGVDFSRYNGLDFSDASGIAYLGTADGSGAPQASLYELDVTSGRTTLLGLIGDPGEGVLVRGLTVMSGIQSLTDIRVISPIPEPGTATFVALGCIAGLAMRRRSATKAQA